MLSAYQLHLLRQFIVRQCLGEFIFIRNDIVVLIYLFTDAGYSAKNRFVPEIYNFQKTIISKAALL